MQKEFINHKQAIDLKELGFDENCLAYWLSNNTLHIGVESSVVMLAAFGNITYTKAPLNQQAFRWLRDKHNLVGNITSIYLDETHTDYKFWFYIQDNNDDDEEVFYGTYEEAEEECLNKLINISKKTRLFLPLNK